MTKTILIGNHLTTTNDYQLNINYDNTFINRIMTEEEYQAVITIMQDAQHRKEGINVIVKKIEKYYKQR